MCCLSQPSLFFDLNNTVCLSMYVQCAVRNVNTEPLEWKTLITVSCSFSLHQQFVTLSTWCTYASELSSCARYTVHDARCEGLWVQTWHIERFGDGTSERSITFDSFCQLRAKTKCHLFLNINELDALNFIISLFQASTCFEHMCSSSGGQNCIIQSLVSSHL